MIRCSCNGKGVSCVSGGGNGLLGQSCNCHQCAWQAVIGVGIAVVHFWKVGRILWKASGWVASKQCGQHTGDGFVAAIWFQRMHAW